MISENYIQEWKAKAPWPQSSQIEQDLILNRVLCELFSEKLIQSSLAFRGGTSLQKIFLKNPSRYSEDIDLVQIKNELIKPVIKLIRQKLDPWLGEPTFSRKDVGRVVLRYRYSSEVDPVVEMKLKIEINNGEHFSVYPHKKVVHSVDSSWFTGRAEITTFELEEIMGTKLRALYQRKKGRDLFDFQKVFDEFQNLSDDKVIICFQKYLEYEGKEVSRAEFEKNLVSKIKDASFRNDIAPLLPENASTFDIDLAYRDIQDRLISKLPGNPWKGLGTKK
jgi:predicted nucleotidyltransferase component of viral defense system